jgi:hypothetical protein
MGPVVPFTVAVAGAVHTSGGAGGASAEPDAANVKTAPAVREEIRALREPTLRCFMEYTRPKGTPRRSIGYLGRLNKGDLVKKT